MVCDMRWHTDKRGSVHVGSAKWNLCSLVGGGSHADLGLGEVYYSYPFISSKCDNRYQIWHKGPLVLLVFALSIGSRLV